MSPDTLVTAHRLARQRSAREGEPTDGLWMAALRCLKSDRKVVRRDGALLLATLAAEDWQTSLLPVYDLSRTIADEDPVTRSATMYCVQQVAFHHPRLAAFLLPDVVERLRDPDPVVREGACRAIAWIARYLVEEDGTVDEGRWERWERPPPIADALRDAAAPLIDLLPRHGTTAEYHWTAAHDLPFSGGPVEDTVSEGAERTGRIQWNAAFALAMAAPLIASRIETASTQFIDIAFTGIRTEARGYAIDALARADATAALGKVRDWAISRLRHDVGDRSVPLYALSTLGETHGELLAPAEETLRRFSAAEGSDQQFLAENALFAGRRAGVIDFDHEIGRLFDLVLVEDHPFADGEFYGSTARLAGLARAAPATVLPTVTAALDIAAERDTTRRSPRLEADRDWDTSLLWEVLERTAETNPDQVRAYVDLHALRTPENCRMPAVARRLFGQLVSLPVSEAEMDRLFAALQDQRDGAKETLRTLHARQPETVLQTARRVLPDVERPSEATATFVRELAAKDADSLGPLAETLRRWYRQRHPSSDVHDDILRALGDVAVATDDRELAAELCRPLNDAPSLHPYSGDAALKRYARLGVLVSLLTHFPSLVAPAVLDALNERRASVRRELLRCLATIEPSSLDGWGGAVRESALSLSAHSDARTSGYAARVLGQYDDDASRERLLSLAATTENPHVRFEALRALHRRDEIRMSPPFEGAPRRSVGRSSAR